MSTVSTCYGHPYMSLSSTSLSFLRFLAPRLMDTHFSPLTHWREQVTVHPRYFPPVCSMTTAKEASHFSVEKPTQDRQECKWPHPKGETTCLCLVQVIKQELLPNLCVCVCVSVWGVLVSFEDIRDGWCWGFIWALDWEYRARFSSSSGILHTEARGSYGETGSNL